MGPVRKKVTIEVLETRIEELETRLSRIEKLLTAAKDQSWKCQRRLFKQRKGITGISGIFSLWGGTADPVRLCDQTGRTTGRMGGALSFLCERTPERGKGT